MEHRRAGRAGKPGLRVLQQELHNGVIAHVPVFAAERRARMDRQTHRVRRDTFCIVVANKGERAFLESKRAWVGQQTRAFQSDHQGKTGVILQLVQLFPLRIRKVDATEIDQVKSLGNRRGDDKRVCGYCLTGFENCRPILTVMLDLNHSVAATNVNTAGQMLCDRVHATGALVSWMTVVS